MFLLLPLYGGFAGAIDGVGKAWAASLAPADRQSGAQGPYQATTGGAVLIACTWAGLDWNTTGQLPLLISGIAAAALAAALAVTGRWYNPNST